MTDPNLTHLYFLLDRSGSMQTIVDDVRGGFDAFVAEQRRAPGTCRVTLAQFDDSYEEVYADLPVGDVPPLVLQPRGRTALLDSLGRLDRRRRAAAGRPARGRAPGHGRGRGDDRRARERLARVGPPADQGADDQKTTTYGWGCSTSAPTRTPWRSA